MNKQDYHSDIVTNVTPTEAFEKIGRVSEWWATNFEGGSQKLNDVFTVRFGSGDMYKVKIIELVPNKKIVWEVIDSYQGWVKDHTEWVGTKILWEVLPKKDGTRIDLTHIGLVPIIECFDKCIQGWDYLLQKSLIKFLTEKKGLPA